MTRARRHDLFNDVVVRPSRHDSFNNVAARSNIIQNRPMLVRPENCALTEPPSRPAMLIRRNMIIFFIFKLLVYIFTLSCSTNEHDQVLLITRFVPQQKNNQGSNRLFGRDDTRCF
jgi:hypothetical protein